MPEEALESKPTDDNPPRSSGETCAGIGKGCVVARVMRDPRAGYTEASFIREPFLVGWIFSGDKSVLLLLADFQVVGFFDGSPNA